MKNNFLIALCVTITIALLYAGAQRWTEGPKQTEKDNDTDIIINYKKDNWAKQNWIVIYGIDGKKSYYGDEKPVSGIKDLSRTEKIRHQLTYAWFGITLLFLFLSLFGFITKLFPKARKEKVTAMMTASGLKGRL